MKKVGISSLCVACLLGALQIGYAADEAAPTAVTTRAANDTNMVRPWRERNDRHGRL